MSTEKPNNCPFCGAPANFGEVQEGENFGGQFIECSDPMCGASTCLMFPTMDSVKDQLLEKWNRRHELAASQAENAKLREALKELDAALANFDMKRAFYDEFSDDRAQLAQEVSDASCRLTDATTQARAALSTDQKGTGR